MLAVVPLDVLGGCTRGIQAVASTQALKIAAQAAVSSGRAGRSSTSDLIADPGPEPVAHPRRDLEELPALADVQRPLARQRALDHVGHPPRPRRSSPRSAVER